MEPTCLFLDTEWADVLDADFVSLALVSADTGKRVYAERNRLPECPTDFVRVAASPLLESDSVALSDAASAIRLGRFARGIEKPFVLFDYPNAFCAQGRRATGRAGLGDWMAQCDRPVHDSEELQQLARIRRDWR